MKGNKGHESTATHGCASLSIAQWMQRRELGVQRIKSPSENRSKLRNEKTKTTVQLHNTVGQWYSYDRWFPEKEKAFQIMKQYTAKWENKKQENHMKGKNKSHDTTAEHGGPPLPYDSGCKSLRENRETRNTSNTPNEKTKTTESLHNTVGPPLP